MRSHSRRIVRLRPYAAPAVVFGLAAIVFGCEPDLDSLTSETALGAGGGKAGNEPEGGNAGMSTSGGTNPFGGSGNPTGGSGGDGGDAGGGPTPASCENGKRGADESDVDCGGSSECDRCEVGKSCTQNSDCESAFCTRGKCAEPSCSDGHQNQDETDEDCGGSCSAKCERGQGCVTGSDCTTAYCTSEDVCGDHCESGRRESDESDIDCGGSSCDPCENNRRCLVPTDCVSGICSNNACVPPSCDDGFKNQNESDIDCGGVCAAAQPCAVGKRCVEASDCSTYICGSNGKCSNDITIPVSDVIDDMEDLNLSIAQIGGRLGNWYPIGDGSGKQSLEVTLIPGTRGTSKSAVHTTATDFAKWGSGVGFDFNQPGSTSTSKLPYDASNYAGVTFWARAAATTTISVVFPDKNTDPAGAICTVCDHHFLKNVPIDTQWRRYNVLFDDTMTDGGGTPNPEKLSTEGLIAMHFRASAGINYDLWIDDVAFLRP